jgi:hypothetical protein
MVKWTIEPKIRPCIIKNYHQPGCKSDIPAWFHCWVTNDGETMALVELENGECRFIKPRRIIFIDSKRVKDEYDISHKYPQKECEIRGE